MSKDQAEDELSELWSGDPLGDPNVDDDSDEDDDSEERIRLAQDLAQLPQPYGPLVTLQSRLRIWVKI